MPVYPQGMLQDETGPGRVIVRGDGSTLGTRVYVLTEEGREVEIAAMSVEISVNHGGASVPVVKIVADHPRLHLVSYGIKP